MTPVCEMPDVALGDNHDVQTMETLSSRSEDVLENNKETYINFPRDSQEVQLIVKI